MLWYDIGWLAVLLLKLCLGRCLDGLDRSLGPGIRWVLLLLGDRPLIVQQVLAWVESVRPTTQIIYVILIACVVRILYDRRLIINVAADVFLFLPIQILGTDRDRIGCSGYCCGTSRTHLFR